MPEAGPCGGAAVRVSLIVALTAGGLVGCSFTGDPRAADYRCEGDGDCPSGMTCSSSGTCEGGEVDAGTPTEGIDGQPPGGSDPCGSLSTLHDTFDAETLDRRLWIRDQAGQGTEEVVDGRLVLSTVFGDGEPGSGYASLWSRHAYSLSGGRIAVEIAKQPTNAAFSVRLEAPGSGESLWYELSEGGLSVSHFTGESWEDLGGYPTPVAHMGIRRVGDELVFERSDDGIDWTPVTTWSGGPMGPVYVVMELDPSEDSVGAGAVAVEGIGPGSAMYCAASTLTDDFSADKEGGDWRLFAEGGCGPQTEAGSLKLNSTGDLSATCGRRSLAGWSMADSAITVELVARPAYATGFFGIRPSEDTFIGFGVTPTLLVAGTIEAGDIMPVVSRALDLETHRFMRVSGEGDFVRFETSTDGVEFEPFGMLGEEMTNLDAVSVELSLSAESLTEAGSVEFDSLNVAVD